MALHVLLAVGLWHALQFPRALAYFMDQPSRSRPMAERVRFLRVAPPKAPVTVTSRPFVPPVRRQAQGGGPEESPPPSSPPAGPPPAPIVVPTEVPTGIPPASGGANRIDGPTSGPLVAGRGDARGVQPGYTEPRIWIEAQPVTGAALEGDAKLDSAVAAFIMAARDSVAANTYQPNKFERGDWTYTTRDGKKYGIDGQFIRLGKVAIPTALLGLLPMNQVQGNPIANERQRRLDAMRVEIIAQAQQAMNEEEFRRAVKQIRERKERERKELEKKKKKEQVKVISYGALGRCLPLGLALLAGHPLSQRSHHVHDNA